jgi:hypothetical protein
VRASAVAPQFVAGGLFTLPVLAVVLVAFAGDLTTRARQVVQTAVAVQSVTLGLGVLTWVGALGGHLRHGVWFTTVTGNRQSHALGGTLTLLCTSSRSIRL